MKRVLIVDDQEIMLSMLQRNLNKIPNVEARTAESAEEALAILSDTTIDLVITDINMPGMGGIDLLIEIKKLYPNTNVIVMTAYPSTSHEKEAMLHGSLRFIEKPFDINEIKEIVKDVLFQDEGFQGTVGGVDLIDIVQFNGMSKATSALKVTTADQEGMIFFVNGEVVHAMCGEESGEDAFFTILEFHGGSLETIKGVEAPLVSINNSLQSLLIEVATRKDENGKEGAASETSESSTLFDGPASLSDSSLTNQKEVEGKESIQTTEDEEMTEIQNILAEFTNIEGVHTACLVGRDGFLLDSLARSGIDAEMIGAIASSGFGSAEAMGNQLGQGNLTMTMIEYTAGPVLFAPVGEEAFLVIVADKDTNLGWIRIAIKKNSSKIEQIASL